MASANARPRPQGCLRPPSSSDSGRVERYDCRHLSRQASRAARLSAASPSVFLITASVFVMSFSAGELRPDAGHVPGHREPRQELDAHRGALNVDRPSIGVSARRRNKQRGCPSGAANTGVGLVLIRLFSAEGAPSEEVTTQITILDQRAAACSTASAAASSTSPAVLPAAPSSSMSGMPSQRALDLEGQLADVGRA